MGLIGSVCKANLCNMVFFLKGKKHTNLFFLPFHDYKHASEEHLRGKVGI